MGLSEGGGVRGDRELVDWNCRSPDGRFVIAGHREARHERAHEALAVGLHEDSELLALELLG